MNSVSITNKQWQWRKQARVRSCEQERHDPIHTAFESRSLFQSYLLTVAGEACSKSWGSKIMFWSELIWIISPLIKHSCKSKSTVSNFPISLSWPQTMSTHRSYFSSKALNSLGKILGCPWQTFLLSSSTVFMFSIQTASTGPSNTIHFRSSLTELACSRKVFASTPG